MQEPWSRVISRKTNDCLLTLHSTRDGISSQRILVVQLVCLRGLDDVEIMLEGIQVQYMVQTSVESGFTP